MRHTEAHRSETQDMPGAAAITARALTAVVTDPTDAKPTKAPARVRKAGKPQAAEVALSPIAELLAERNSIERKIEALDKQRKLHPERAPNVWGEIDRLEGLSRDHLQSIMTMRAQTIDDVMIKLRAQVTDMCQAEVENEGLPVEHFIDVYGDYWFGARTLHALCRDALRLAPQVEVVWHPGLVDPKPPLAPAASIADAETPAASEGRIFVEGHDTWEMINSIAVAANDTSDLAQALLLLSETADTTDLDLGPALAVISRTLDDLAKKIDVETDSLVKVWSDERDRKEGAK